MMVNWVNILNRLSAYPPRVHRLLPPCSEERMRKVQADLGKFPEDLADMLKHLNGGKLFVRGIQLVSIFRASDDQPLPALEWAPEWCIETFTPKWRSSGVGRQQDWVIAMMNYGGLIVVTEDGKVREWDTAQRKWGATTPSLGDWFEWILREGEAYMKEV